MPLDSAIVGATSDLAANDIDARWTMAYAAALGDMLPCYVDTLHPEQLLAHPLFPVCFEWPVFVGSRNRVASRALKPEEAARGVHATHDLILNRPIRPPERLWTRLTIAGVERRTPGAYQLTRMDTIDASGATVCTSWYGTIYLGVAVAGPDRPAPEAPEAATPQSSVGASLRETKVKISAGIAHVYTECARIFNPIHTDAAAAKRAGLPSIILHGTATLALAVSQVVESEADGDPSRVNRIAGRFGAMVPMPSELKMRIVARDESGAFFDALTSEGKPAIRNGFVGLRR